MSTPGEGVSLAAGAAQGQAGHSRLKLTKTPCVVALMHRTDVDGLAARLVVPRSLDASLGLLEHGFREA